MRCLIAIACVGVMLWGGMSMPTRAQQENTITGDTLLDISLRDADLSETLTALFSTAKDKYEMVLGSGVAGRIARLQLAQAPFEKALDAILGSDYSYSKKPQADGRFLYRITGRQGRSGSGLRGSGSVIVAQAPPLDADLGRQLNSTLMAQMGGFEGMTPGGFVPSRDSAPGGFVPPSGGTPGGYGASGASGTPAGGFNSSGGAGFWGGSSRPGGIAATAGMPASTESFIIKLIRINNIDIAALCESMGMETIDLGSLMTTAENGSSGGGSRSTSRNNNNNDNNYNSNNTSTNRNRTSRTTRTSRTNTNTTANSNYIE